MYSLTSCSLICCPSDSVNMLTVDCACTEGAREAGRETDGVEGAGTG